MDDRKIGIFDSGVGGLTVFSEIKKMLPNESLMYIGDTKRFPYGNKSKKTIIDIAKQITDILIEKQVKMIVIACGTATSQALEELKQIFKIPIIGIILPTVENIINQSTKSIGVIATKGTIKSKAWNQAIYKQNRKVKLIENSAPLLAPMAEEGWVSNPAARFAIRRIYKTIQRKSRKINFRMYPLSAIY